MHLSPTPRLSKSSSVLDTSATSLLAVDLPADTERRRAKRPPLTMLAALCLAVLCLAACDDAEAAISPEQTVLPSSPTTSRGPIANGTESQPDSDLQQAAATLEALTLETMPPIEPLEFPSLEPLAPLDPGSEPEGNQSHPAETTGLASSPSSTLDAPTSTTSNRPAFESGITADEFAWAWSQLGAEQFFEVGMSVDASGHTWSGSLTESVKVLLLSDTTSLVLREIYILFPDETLVTGSTWLEVLGTTLSVATDLDQGFGMRLILDALEQGGSTGEFAAAAEGLEFCMVQNAANGAQSQPDWTIRIIASTDGSFCQP